MIAAFFVVFCRLQHKQERLLLNATKTAIDERKRYRYKLTGLNSRRKVVVPLLNVAAKRFRSSQGVNVTNFQAPARGQA